MKSVSDFVFVTLFMKYANVILFPTVPKEKQKQEIVPIAISAAVVSKSDTLPILLRLYLLAEVIQCYNQFNR